jgi:hypothetical protein
MPEVEIGRRLPVMDFDQHAATYQEAVDQAAGVSAEKLAGEKARIIFGVLAGCFDNPKESRVLDIGCGIGLIDRDLAWESRVVGNRHQLALNRASSCQGSGHTVCAL